MPDPLDAVSPLDGRYAGRTAPLRPYVSEAALMRARVRVEVEYLIALADLEATPITLDDSDRRACRTLYEDFDAEDAELVKTIETEGHGRYPATNHDVKAVEYFLRIGLPADLDHVHPWIHFGLTSEDVNNLAYRLLVAPAVTDVLRPRLAAVRMTLVELATDYRDAVMLARTHGQPATPTTFGKEMAVFVSRLDRAIDRIDAAVDALGGKLAGASGTYAAHVAGYPRVDWRSFAESFVTSLGLEHLSLATQVNPGDDLAALFDGLRGANNVLLDLDKDCWRYVSDGYLGQATTADETGSSTMPHKVNPIDFENSEGNLSKANADLVFLGDFLTKSRLQRDLADSTVARNIGAALAHCLIGYEKTADGLETVVPNEQRMRDDLTASPAVIGEAVQTILRREGKVDAYERIKDLSRGRRVTLDDFRELFAELDLDEDVREELLALSPETYVGLASELVDEVDVD